MKKFLQLFCVCILLAVPAAAEAELFSDKIAAVVNGDVILESDIKQQKLPFIRNIGGLPLGVVPPGKWPTEREILDELVIIHILEQEAAKKGLKIDDKNVDLAIDSIRKRNNLAPDQFALFLAANGLTVPEYRKMIKRQFLLTRLIASEVTQKVPLNEEDAIAFWKKYKTEIDDLHRQALESMMPAAPQREEKQQEIPTHEDIYMGGKIRLRQITLKLDDKGKNVEKQMDKAKLIFREAMTGADFSQLAKKYSQDSNAAAGGDLGLMNYKDMVPGFQKLVQRLKEGDITPPIKTPNAILIFYLAEAKDRTKKQVPIPEKIRKQIEQQMKAAQERRVEKKKSVESEKPEVEADPKEQPKLPKGLLTEAEEKEYLKARRKVIELVRKDRIQARMKDWINDLKKGSIIEVRI